MASTTVIATSVVRSAHKGQSHGGVYLVDLDAQRFEQVVDWDRMDIDWAGRGLDRGLRGIAFHDGRTLIAASDEILAYDRDFRVVERFTNPYLAHCHEIDVDGDLLWATSTGFDSLLALDLRKGELTHGVCLRLAPWGRWRGRFFPGTALPRARLFDPRASDGPTPGDTLHLNMVTARDGVLYCSGTGSRHLVRVAGDRVSSFAKIPLLTHNTRPYRDGVLMCHTNANAVRWATRRGVVREEWEIVTYDSQKLAHDGLPDDHARQGFARGLCVSERGEIIVGSSPATISRYAHGEPRPEVSVNLTLDVRNAIHGLEIYPYS